MLTTNGKVLEENEFVYYAEERHLHKVRFGVYNFDNYNDYIKNKKNIVIFKTLDELTTYANNYYTNKKQ